MNGRITLAFVGVAALALGCAQILGIEDLPSIEDARHSPTDSGSEGVDANTSDAQRSFDDTCKRVDIVISVDASSSMTEEIAEFAETVFPKLLERLRAIGGGLENYRVAVLDACPVKADFHTVRDNRTPEGESCNFESGERWMDTSSSNLESEFACVANIYIGDYVKTQDGGVIGVDCTSDNDNEQPARTILKALTDFSAPGQPNEGFLRDDALLLMIGITDEDERPLEQPDGENAYVLQLYEDLVAIKGDVDRMVFMGVGGSMACVDENGYGATREARRLRKLSQHFIDAEQGVFWDLCEGYLEEGIAEAMKVIERTCHY